MERKEFIEKCGLLCMGSLALVLIQNCGVSNFYAQHTIDKNSIKINKNQFQTKVKDKLIDRKYILIKPENLSFPICVFKISDNEFSAISTECSHRSCELKNQGDYLVCPCHGSEFSNKGIVQNPPAEQNLKTFKIITDAENIYIAI
jgi:cytochrome b6-f complex iron-sulfur subunit